MLSARLDYTDPEFPVSLVELDEPTLPRGDWARVAVTRAGICGSDLHLIRPHPSGTSPIWGPFAAFPMELGHEIGGVVVEAGPDCPVPEGTRVAIDPTIACAARGLDPCSNCARGWVSSCVRLDDKTVTPGMGHGFTSGLGAGWSERLVAHASQIHPLPTAVDDRAAPLTEPLSIALHGLLRRPPELGVPALVIGAGIIGLAAVAALRSVTPTSDITVLARHDQQAAAATAVGATHVVRPDDGMAALAEAGASRLVGRKDGAVLTPGFPVVVEAVGTGETLGLALRAAAPRGVVHLLGAVGTTTADLTALWFRELDVVGSFCHAVDQDQHSFDRAIALLAEGALPPDLVVTHELPLVALRDAVDTALARDRGAIKVLLRPQEGS